jgi:dual specificity tyrosine-phosphorylation-regulated kinase 2/3/4
MDPRSAVINFSKYLLEIEKSEILDYETIYFFNINKRKQKNMQGMTPDGVDNNGFDNDKNEYITEEGQHIAYRYEITDRLGKGSFGQVFKCFDHKNQEVVALKILRNKKRLYKQGLIEAKILEELCENDPEDKKNIIRIKEKFVFRKHLILSFEMLSMNLYEFIKSNNFQGVSVGLVRRFAIQLLVSLHYMKEHNIIHCDMKPENILLRKPNKSGIKVIDFGSGTYENEQFYTYI